MTAVVFLCGVTLSLVGGCSGDDAGTAASELSAFLLEDTDVVTVLPELEAKSDYSTGEDYGVAQKSELTGPTESAEAAVVRQWSQGSDRADEGDAVTVISSVFEFPSAEEAESAAESVFVLVGTDPVEVQGALMAITEPQDGLSSAVAVARRDSLVATVQIGYIGRSDEQSAQRLAAVTARRLD